MLEWADVRDQGVAGLYVHMQCQLNTQHLELSFHNPLLHRVAHEFGIVFEIQFLKNTGTVGTDCGRP